MNLSQGVRSQVTLASLKYVKRERTNEFTCIDYVREVYREVGIEIPLIWGYVAPPKEFNSSKEMVTSWEDGYIIFLKRKKYTGTRVWTHVAITLAHGNAIHCSEYFGGKVLVSSKEEVLQMYHYVFSD